MIIVLASIHVKPDQLTPYLEIFKSNVPSVLAEAGCIEYTPTIDIESGLPIQQTDANIVTIVEKWESIEALHKHLASPHMQAYQKAVKDMVEGAELKVLQNA